MRADPSRAIAARIVGFAEELRALIQTAAEEALRREVHRSIRALASGAAPAREPVARRAKSVR